MYALNGVLSVNYNLTAASTVAAQGFWTALRANPIGVLVTIVGTLVSSYYAYKAVTAEVITILGEQELKLKTQQTQLNAVAQVALTAAAGTDARRNAIYQLIREYPEYFKGIDAEKVTNTQLKAILDKVNSSYRERIGLAREAYKAEQIANTQKELFQKSLRFSRS